VDSNFKNPQGSRFEFKFQSCALKWKFIELPLPPVGEGWGEVLFIDLFIYCGFEWNFMNYLFRL
jgi:hypothetical protein